MKRTASLPWRCADRVLDPAVRPLLMGILNVTPDSFSDGGRYIDFAAAVARGRQMEAEGADILDVGGESTRPGAEAVSEDEECRRVIPVIRELARSTAAVLSVDTMKAGVAREALWAGARIVNDVSALTHDPAMVAVAREARAGVVLMHMQGSPRTMQQEPRYDDVVAEVGAYLRGRVDALVGEGLSREALAIDPGIGFGKTVEHNLALLAHLPRLGVEGRPLVVGLSRKSFLGKLAGAAVENRLAGSLAALTYCLLHGAQVMRVHDVGASRQAMMVAMALAAAEKGTADRVG